MRLRVLNDSARPLYYIGVKDFSDIPNILELGSELAYYEVKIHAC